MDVEGDPGERAGVFSRRGLIGGGAALGVAPVFGTAATDRSTAVATARALHPATGRSWGGSGRDPGPSALGFTAVAASQTDAIVVPDGDTIGT